MKEVPGITMLYSLSSFVWGESSFEQDGPLPPTTTLHRRDDSLDEEDWVVVGRVAQFPGTLAGNLALPESSTPMLVSPAMSEFDATEEEIVDNEEVTPIVLTQEQAPAPRCMAKMIRRTQEKQLRSAQLARQKYFGKSSSKKILKRSNMTAGRSNKSERKSFQIKMAGAHRNLKQC